MKRHDRGIEIVVIELEERFVDKDVVAGGEGNGFVILEIRVTEIPRGRGNLTKVGQETPIMDDKHPIDELPKVEILDPQIRSCRGDYLDGWKDGGISAGVSSGLCDVES